MRKFFVDFISYLTNISKEGTKESSKRALAIYTTVVLTSYAVFRFTDKHNMEFVIGELLTYALALLGVTAWEKHSANKHKNKKNENN